jgi:hypothetical protein
MGSYQEASLTTLAGGKAIKKFDYELSRVIENIRDPNKDFKAKRTVTLKVTFQPNPERMEMGATIDVDSKLAPDLPATDHILLTQDGEAFVNNSNQMDITEMLKSGEIEMIDGEAINKKTGEVMQ